MPGRLSVLVGIVARLAVVAGGALRPDPRADYEPWLPEPHRDPPRNNFFANEGVIS